MQHFPLDGFPLGPAHPAHVGGGGRSAPAVDAVLGGTRAPLPHPVHHAPLHGAGGVLQQLVVKGRPVSLLHPHPRHPHHPAHGRLFQRLPEGKARVPFPHFRFLQSPAPVQAADEPPRFPDPQHGFHRGPRLLFPSLGGLDRGLGLLLPALGVQGPRGGGLARLLPAQGRAFSGAVPLFLPPGKQLQIHHSFLAPAAGVGKAQMVGVTLGQQGQSRLGQLKAAGQPLAVLPSLTGGSRHRDAGPVGAVGRRTLHLLAARRHPDQRLHQDARPGADDVLSSGRIVCVAPDGQPAGDAVGSVQLVIKCSDHTCTLLSLGFMARRAASAGPAGLGMRAPVRGAPFCA